MQLDVAGFIHGTTSVSNWVETQGVLGADNLHLVSLGFVKSYMNESIRGSGELQLQCVYYADGRISFTGYELFSGMIGDCRGTLVFDVSGSAEVHRSEPKRHNTLLSDRQLDATVLFSKGAGTGELCGLRGSGSFVIARQSLCSFELNVTN